MAQRAEEAAAQTHRQIEDVLADWLERTTAETQVADLSDEDVLALSELRLTEDQQQALDALLVQSREGTLDFEGSQRLDDLMHVYEGGLLRKAQALREAVRRGLREPLQP